MILVTDSELTTLFDEPTFRRGRSYSREGAVADVREDGDRVRARVQGSRPRPYEVWVRRDGNLLVSQCNCPGWAGARRHCKHVAALLYTLHEQNPAASPPPPTERLPSPLVWLSSEAPKIAIPLYYSLSIEGDAAFIRQLRVDNGIPPDPSVHEALPTEDRRIAELLALFPEASGGRRVELSRAGDVVAALRGKAIYADDRREIPLGFWPEPLGLRIAVTKPERAGDPYRMRASLSPKSGERTVALAKVRILGGTARFALADDVLYPLDPRLTDAALGRVRAAPDVECRAAELARAFGEWLPRLSEATGAQAPSPAELLATVGGIPEIDLVCEGDLGHATVRIEARYGEGIAVEIVPGVASPPSEVRIGVSGEPFVLLRDAELEREAWQRLEEAGLVWEDGAFRAEGETALRFWSNGIGRLPSGWRRRLPPGLVGLRVRHEPVTASLRVGFGAKGWFEVDLRLGHPEAEVDVDVLRAALADGLSHVTLKDGSVAPIDRAAVGPVLAALDDSDGLLAPGRTELPPWLAGVLGALVAAVGAGAKLEPEAAALLQALEGQALPKLEPPAGLAGKLRPYQAAGYSWLAFLKERGLGALLADEMGLGKTIQALAYLLLAKERGETAPALVVTPTSVLPNWLREAERFTPSLRAIAFSGGKRKLPAAGEADLVVTSYALLRRDAEQLAGVDWSAVILDEAQHVKNPSSATAQAAWALPGKFRVVLTGTPVENRPLDLWSLFRFLVPGLLGGQEDFRRRYEGPVGEAALAAQRRLALRIRPFLKRRLKRDVLSELPEKQEAEVVCDLTEPQRKIYRQVLDEVRREVFGAIEERGVARSQVNILAGLLRLRQVACDPRLLKVERETSAEDSAKLQLWRELLDEALDGGHRVICFSQFVEMLSLMRRELDGAKIPYEYLDGRTRDRQAIIDRFNGVEGKPSADVFLISLRAGGTGVNLATADTVLLYDPWWNPAVEDQAVDRVHRIGQSREVSVYRLVARGTVEEKILELKQKKRDVSGRLLSGEGGGAAFTAEEVEELLRVG